jgi:hypothetical protein
VDDVIQKEVKQVVRDWEVLFGTQFTFQYIFLEKGMVVVRRKPLTTD